MALPHPIEERVARGPGDASKGAWALAGSPEKPVASYVGEEAIARIAPLRGSIATTAPTLDAELCLCEVLQPPIDGERQVVRIGLASEDVVEQVTQRIRVAAAGEQVVPGALHPVAPKRRLAYPIRCVKAGSV